MNDCLSKFPMAPLSELPTPVIHLSNLEKKYRHGQLFTKLDSISGPEYGGNKIRKLEFLLGEALAEGRKSVITYGAAGSNHALATAICCRRLGLKAISILAPQPTSEHVRKNILMGWAAGAELHLYPHYSAFPEATRRITEEYTQKDGIATYIIPVGGTNPTGALGFVQAAFELAEQLEPDVVYIPMGTGGTLAGLLVGFKLAGLHTRIEAIRVVDPAFRNKIHILRLCRELCEKLGLEPLVHESEICIRDGFLGEDYGIPTPEGQEAVSLFGAMENMLLENTYTGKTAAALLHDLQCGHLDAKTVLYWNTLNARDFSRQIEAVEYRSLPPEFHPFF